MPTIVGPDTSEVLRVRDELASKPEGLAGASATDLARVLVMVHRRKQTINAELDIIDRTKSALSEMTIEALSREGVGNIGIGGFTVSAYAQVFPKFKDGCTKSDVCDALEKTGNGDLVSLGYNSQSLGSLIREMADPDSGEIVMPDDLAAVLATSEVSKISIKKSKA